MGIEVTSEPARMVKSADTADLKSADLNRSWGFKSPSGHQETSGFIALVDALGCSVKLVGLGTVTCFVTHP